MTNIKTLISDMPEYAGDVRQNIEKLLTVENTILTPKQIFGAALAAGYTTKEKRLIANLENEAKLHLDRQEFRAVRVATSLASLKNIYHRFCLASGKEAHCDLEKSGLSNHGIEQATFDCYLLAVSIINSCSDCIKNCSEELKKGGLSDDQIDAIAKIAATVNAAGQVLRIEEIVE